MFLMNGTGQFHMSGVKENRNSYGDWVACKSVRHLGAGSVQLYNQFCSNGRDFQMTK